MGMPTDGRNPNLRMWNTQSYSAAEAVDRWSLTMSRNFLPWTLANRPAAPFTASVDSAEADDLRLIHCQCDSNRGFRRRAEIARTDGAHFGILCVLAGREVITVRDRQIVLETGNFLVWDSEEPMEYALLGPLEKATIIAPRELLLSAVPHARRLVGQKFNQTPGVESVFFNYVKSLVSSMRHMSAEELRTVLGASLDMLARTTWSTLAESNDVRYLTLIRIQKYIESRLHEPGLGPAQIASACGISVRSLHALFAGTGESVCEWIRERRLERCRADLVGERTAGVPVARIAMRWGFSEPAHFSRVFRAKYGLSPGAYRQDATGRSAAVPQ
jgi:AraC-like DNA-binding protein